MSYQLITTNEQLHNYCSTINDVTSFALDSEFVRTRTFYPQLGLLQLFDGHNTVLIDPLNISNWSELIIKLRINKIEKYFHACSEDIEVFLHHFDFVPLPILDSQILAAFLDNPLSTGYAALVKKYLDIDLDKSETRTDWLQRPLTDKQCQYAANDVVYLLPLMVKLKELVTQKGWLAAAYEECDNAVKRRRVVVKPEKAYLQIKNAWQLRPNQLAILQKLAYWRYNYAKEYDIALNFVVHEEVLWKIARYQPKSLAELSSLGLKGKEVRLFGNMLLAILNQPIVNIDPIKRVVDYPDYKKWSVTIKESAAVIAQDTQLNEAILVSKRHIDEFVQWLHSEREYQPELLSGWRGELFKPFLQV